MQRIRDKFNVRLILKGIGTGEDAALACDEGVDCVYISNHGGRQLDHCLGAIDVLPEVVSAVAGRAKVVVDGGFNRGTDIVKAMALGADMVGIGRIYCYGLVAAGSDGIVRALELLEAEIVECLGLLGVTIVTAHGTQPRLQDRAGLSAARPQRLSADAFAAGRLLMQRRNRHDRPPSSSMWPARAAARSTLFNLDTDGALEAGSMCVTVPGTSGPSPSNLPLAFAPDRRHALCCAAHGAVCRHRPSRSIAVSGTFTCRSTAPLPAPMAYISVAGTAVP